MALRFIVSYLPHTGTVIDAMRVYSSQNQKARSLPDISQYCLQ